MKIVPTQVEEQINRMDRNQSLIIGIVCVLVALWSAYALITLLYWGLVLSSYGFSPISLVIGFVWRGVIGAVAVIGAIGCFTRYAATRP